MSATDTSRGLFHKFNVRRTDGQSDFGCKHFACEYFVLDMTHDPHAAAALRAYAASCATTHPQLSADLLRMLDVEYAGFAWAPESANRPSPEWYAAKIQETLDDDFSVGPTPTGDDL